MAIDIAPVLWSESYQQPIKGKDKLFPLRNVAAGRLGGDPISSDVWGASLRNKETGFQKTVSQPGDDQGH